MPPGGPKKPLAGLAMINVSTPVDALKVNDVAPLKATGAPPSRMVDPLSALAAATMSVSLPLVPVIVTAAMESLLDHRPQTRLSDSNLASRLQRIVCKRARIGHNQSARC